MKRYLIFISSCIALFLFFVVLVTTPKQQNCSEEVASTISEKGNKP
ncbi:hypothetical protein LCGC14_1345360 [marine sediment metagenome]|uniref:Uncharacterized protein n=1 Tax=marine sediment metagenome TaxID=412755 RepID=A0A0F9KD62_9ZZZZ